jgi:hypothetical protein
MITTCIVDQLWFIYQNFEFWHTTRLTYDEACKYHQERLDSGNIHVYEEDGQVLGYYESYDVGSERRLNNVVVLPGYRRGRVFKELCKHFFDTMPDNIDRITGTKQKLFVKWREAKLSKLRRIHGND